MTEQDTTAVTAVSIPDDVAKLWDEHSGCCAVRDSAVKLPFGYRKAKRAAMDAAKAAILAALSRDVS